MPRLTISGRHLKATGPLTGVGMTGTGKNRQFSYPYPYPHFTRTCTRAGYPNPCSCLLPYQELRSAITNNIVQCGVSLGLGSLWITIDKVNPDVEGWTFALNKIRLQRRVICK